MFLRRSSEFEIVRIIGIFFFFSLLLLPTPFCFKFVYVKLSTVEVRIKKLKLEIAKLSIHWSKKVVESELKLDI